ncbi:hypothetical protein EDD22DRAFT_853242 [Suillus occidentalis]|nr:hypothetical protein EDD22DRAFT_853242 [Suillus occidentalis]
MVNDGGALKEGAGGQFAAHQILAQQLFIFDLLDSGLAMAPLQGADFRDTKLRIGHLRAFHQGSFIRRLATNYNVHSPLPSHHSLVMKGLGHVSVNFIPYEDPDKCLMLSNIGRCTHFGHTLFHPKLPLHLSQAIIVAFGSILFLLKPPHHAATSIQGVSSSSYHCSIVLEFGLLSLMLVWVIYSWPTTNDHLFVVLLKHKWVVFGICIGHLASVAPPLPSSSSVTPIVDLTRSGVSGAAASASVTAITHMSPSMGPSDGAGAGASANMNAANSAKGSVAGSSSSFGTAARYNCHTTATPQWRKDEDGKTIVMYVARTINYMVLLVPSV